MSADLKEPPNRALLFLFHDSDGIVDDSVTYLLESLRPYVSYMLVVSNGVLQPLSRTSLSEVANVVLERENVGFDVGAYREAFKHVGWDKVAQFDEVLLVNSTFFGPVGSFAPLFEEMAGRPADFWGITDHPAVTPHPYTGEGTMPRHLQSYWLGIRKPMLQSPKFAQYWMGLETPRTYSDVVVGFETKFTEHFSDLGFWWECAYPASQFGVDNPAMEAPVALLEAGCPIFKKRLYFHDTPWLATQGVFSGAATSVAVGRGYPEDNVVAGVCRRTNTRELSFAMDATFMVPEHDVNVPSPACLVMERPWKRLVEVGVEGVLGASEILFVDAPAPRRGADSDGLVSAYTYAHDAVVGSAGTVKELFKGHRRLLALFPYTQILSEPVAGRSWFSRTQAARVVAAQLGLKGPFAYSSALAPYRGIAAYRRELLDAVLRHIAEAGGWDALVSLAGSEETLEVMLDLLAADIAKGEGGFVGQIATPTELRRNASLMQDIHSRTPSVHPDYLDYPYEGRVIIPSLKNRIGKKLKNSSPGLFDAAHNAELRLRSTVQKMKGGAR